MTHDQSGFLFLWSAKIVIACKAFLIRSTSIHAVDHRHAQAQENIHTMQEQKQSYITHTHTPTHITVPAAAALHPCWGNRWPWLSEHGLGHPNTAAAPSPLCACFAHAWGPHASDHDIILMVSCESDTLKHVRPASKM
jgi:hypothetical protein